MSEKTTGEPSAQEIRDALAKVLANKPLSGAPQAAAMLRYIVEQTLAGNGADLKAYSIGVDALGRPADFDPQSDPSVRVQARGLRQALTEYYAGAGRDDAVRIDIPTGRYQPAFSKTPDTAAAPRRLFANPMVMTLAGVALAAVLVLAVVFGPRLLAPGPHLPQVARFEGPRVLVQPFAYLRGAPPQKSAQDLAIGLSAELVSDMARYPWLSVVQLPDEEAGLRSLTEKAAGSNPPHYVLSGRVTQGNDIMLVSVTLQSFPALKVKWSSVFREPLDSTDIEELQYRISGKIASIVGSENGILPELLKTNPPPTLAIDIDAFRCFMEIYTYWHDPTDALHGELRDCLEASVKRNPGYAEAWAALAFVYMDEARLGRNPRSGADAWHDAAQAIGKALELAPLNPVVLRTPMI